MKSDTAANKLPRLHPIFYLLTAIFCALALAGCAIPRPLKGGKALTRQTPGGFEQALVQGENPAAASRQAQETIRVRTYALPPPSSSSSFSSSSSINPPIHQSTNPIVLLTERVESRATTELGPAQRDTAREVGAKLSSLKGIVWVGLAMFVFGIASFAWPPLKAIVGSVTTSAAITLGGVALMILPTLVVGHELLILGGVAVGVGAWFVAHRHGRLHGELAATTKHLQSFWNS